jgi:hypothetical protein
VDEDGFVMVDGAECEAAILLHRPLDHGVIRGGRRHRRSDPGYNVGVKAGCGEMRTCYEDFTEQLEAFDPADNQ